MAIGKKLKELRASLGVRQVDFKGISQVEVSKIESRDDIKLSTLIKYLGEIGDEYEIEVRVVSGGKKVKFKV